MGFFNFGSPSFENYRFGEVSTYNGAQTSLQSSGVGGNKLFLGTNTGAITRVDAGGVWDSVSIPTNIPNSILYSGSRLLVGTNNDNCYTSDDDGATWNAQPVVGGVLRAWRFGDVDGQGIILFAGMGASTFFRSEDNGDTFTQQTAGPTLATPASYAGEERLRWIPEIQLWVYCTTANGVIGFSPTGLAADWSVINLGTGLPLRSVIYYQGALYFLSQNGNIYRTNVDFSGVTLLNTFAEAIWNKARIFEGRLVAVGAVGNDLMLGVLQDNVFVPWAPNRSNGVSSGWTAEVFLERFWTNTGRVVVTNYLPAFSS